MCQREICDFDASDDLSVEPTQRLMFRLGLSGDLSELDGSVEFATLGLEALQSVPWLEWEILPRTATELRAEDLKGYDALILEAPRLTADSLMSVERLALVARFGVGYDNVDIEACTASGVIVTITPDGVRRPLAVSAVTFVLALSQWLVAKDRLTRTQRWDDRGRYLGVGLEGRTLGVIGLGNVGAEVMRLIEPFGMRRLAHDPYVGTSVAAAVGAELLDLETLLRESDFVVVLCALTPATRGLLSAERIALMKRSSFLVNVARGPIVDQPALTEALAEGRIRGAGLDVFEREPVDPDDPLLQLDNVIVSPHAICSTDHCLADCGHSALRSVFSVAAGQTPEHVVDRRVLEDERVRERLATFRTRFGLAEVPSRAMD